MFLRNPPGYEAFEEDYAWEETAKQESRKRSQEEPARYILSSGVKAFRGKVMKRHRIASMAYRLVRQHTGGDINILDIGCGWGNVVKKVLDRMPETGGPNLIPHGIELSRKLADISDRNMNKLGGRCVQANALDGVHMFPGDYFDMIIMCSFLEHEINPLPLLRRCRDRLKANGVILIKVPNYQSVNRLVRGSRWSGYRWPDHVNYFTPRTLRMMIEQAGLQVARMNLIDRMPFSDNMYAIVRRA